MTEAQGTELLELVQVVIALDVGLLVLLVGGLVGLGVVIGKGMSS